MRAIAAVGARARKGSNFAPPRALNFTNYIQLSGTYTVERGRRGGASSRGKDIGARARDSPLASRSLAPATTAYGLAVQLESVSRGEKSKARAGSGGGGAGGRRTSLSRVSDALCDGIGRSHPLIPRTEVYFSLPSFLRETRRKIQPPPRSLGPSSFTPPPIPRVSWLVPEE